MALEHNPIKSRQMSGSPGASSGEMDRQVGSASHPGDLDQYCTPKSGKVKNTRRETGATYETLTPNTEFSETGPNSLNEGRMPVEHTSKDH